MAATKITFTVDEKHRVVLRGEQAAVQKIVNTFVRGAVEQYVDEQHAVGRSREEVVRAVLDRIRIADRHYKLGESDGFQCDLRDV